MMKRSYDRPLMSVELFMANQAVSTCTVQGGVVWTFDCMKDNGTISYKVVSTQISTVGSCEANIGYAAGIHTARDYNSNGTHSDNNPSLATWTNGQDHDGRYLQVTYSGGEGLLYTDQDPTKDQRVWRVVSSGGYVRHSGNNGGHHLVAPVMNTQTINASW